MEANKITREDLIGYLDDDEQVSDDQLSAINTRYAELCAGATSDDEVEFNEWYDGLYPPFIAEAVAAIDKTHGND